jgi:hypothetical protein
MGKTEGKEFLDKISYYAQCGWLNVFQPSPIFSFPLSFNVQYKAQVKLFTSEF